MQLNTYFKNTFGVDDLGSITWSHAVNSQEKLSRYLNDGKTMFIESDVRISSQGVPVCVHPPKVESDLTFKELIEKMSQSNQGLKLDFKGPEILITCLELLRKTELKQPVLLNADILQGNGANPSKFNAKGFLALCEKIYPQGILSIGWTTVANPDFPYTQENIDQMLELVKGYKEVTFPIRICLLHNSWQQLSKLVEREGFSLSIWNNEPVDEELKTWIKENTDPQKTFYDFIDENKESLKLW